MLLTETNGDVTVEAEPDYAGEDDNQQLLQLEEVEEEEEAQVEEENGEEEGDDGEEREDEEGEEEPVKLADGFYEIEAIRRKRIHKGELQYLIKWRGWPETANTWEPLENLQSITDVVDAFEDSLQSGKSSRKRKRKGVSSYSLRKKNSDTSVIVYNTKGSGHKEFNSSNPYNFRTRKQGGENGSVKLHETKTDSEFNAKFCELKEVNTDKIAIDFQESIPSEGDGPLNCPPKMINHGEFPQSDRCTGAKKRKSGTVKRFKPDLAPPGQAFEYNPASIGGYNSLLAPVGIENPDLIQPMFDDSFVASSIVKIIKPMGYSASVSDNLQDVLVTFLAVSWILGNLRTDMCGWMPATLGDSNGRSDGRQVMVDNRFLKANNPLLLIEFYERYLRYSPAQ